MSKNEFSPLFGHIHDYCVDHVQQFWKRVLLCRTTQSELMEKSCQKSCCGGDDDPPQVVFKAARAGNKEVVFELLNKYEDLASYAVHGAFCSPTSERLALDVLRALDVDVKVLRNLMKVSDVRYDDLLKGKSYLMEVLEYEFGSVQELQQKEGPVKPHCIKACAKNSDAEARKVVLQKTKEQKQRGGEVLLLGISCEDVEYCIEMLPVVSVTEDCLNLAKQLGLNAEFVRKLEQKRNEQKEQGFLPKSQNNKSTTAKKKKGKRK